MINKKLTFSVLVGLFLISGSNAFADFSFFWGDRNSLRFEYRYFNTLDLDKASEADGDGNSRVFSTFKLRMRPTISISDRLSIYSMFDAYHSPHTTTSQEEGAFAGGQPTDNNSLGPVIGTVPNALFGGASGFSTSALTAGDSNFLIKTLHMEYIGDWGILKLGRIPRHWGLGMRYNAGLKPTDKYSDRTDSFFYELGLGNFKAAAIASKIVETNIDKQSDDMSLYEGYLHYNDPEKDINVGALYTYMRQTNIFTKMNYIDVYAVKKSKNWKAGLEAVASFGTPGTVKGNEAGQLGIASEFEYTWTAAILSYIKAGFASGPDPARTGRLSLFAFDRNYDVALLMFNQGLGAISAQTGVSANSDPDVNAIFGAYYVNPGVTYHFNERIGGKLNYVFAQASENYIAGQDKFIGQEVDVTVWHQFLENWQLGFDAGVFMPGKFFEGDPNSASIPKLDPSIAFQAHATVSF